MNLETGMSKMAHPFREIKGIGESKARRLLEVGIESLEDLIRVAPEELEGLSERTGIGVGMLREYQAQARKLLPELAAEVKRARERRSWLRRIWEKIAG